VVPAENRLPKLVEGIDLRLLPIGPSEAYVLSRVDGTSTEADIAEATGNSFDEVQSVISRLLGLGVLSLGASPVRAPRVHRAAANATAQYAVGAVEERVVRVEHPGASLYDPRELEEDVDIEFDRRKLILDTFHRLGTVNHYELLGIALDADRRAIKARYHEIINIFHPDRYYGKRVGNFKGKLERIFQCLTEAHDVLARNVTRTEYDAYLKLGNKLSSLEQQLHDEEAHARELSAAKARIEAEAARANGPPPVPAPTTSLRAPQPSKPEIVDSAPPQPRSRASMRAPQPSNPEIIDSVPPAGTGPADTSPPNTPARLDAELRRRALARKLGFSSPPPAPNAVSTPIDPAPARERAAHDIRRRYEQHKAAARRSQIEEYLSRANAAMTAKKPVEAVNALRIAVSLAPDDPELAQRLEDLQAEANRELAERYLEQAGYEEREQHWPEAARSYARAVTAKPTPELHERLAHCLLMSQGDRKQAVDHARKAVLLAGNSAKNRHTLAKAYAAAEMRESALRELERAAALAPSDDTIREQLRRAQRGEF
jgi:curved DNA-binding protein CbpA